MMFVRPVNSGDRDEWVRMRTALYPDSGPEEIDDWLDHPEDSEEGLAAAVFVVDRGDDTLGGFIEVGLRNYAEGCVSSPVAFIEAWYVDKDLRRHGLGRELVHAAERWAKQQGLREIASDAERRI